MKKSRAAFTLVELLVASCVACLLGGIIYTMGSEALFSFSRNMSLNRCYSEARSSMDRVGGLMQSAGHLPVLLNEDGSVWASNTLTPSAGNVKATEAAGVRFYHVSIVPTFDITTCTTTGNSMAIAVANAAAAPKIGDLLTVATVGFQGIVSTVSASGASATLTFTNMAGTTAATIGSLCASSNTITDLSPYYCLVYNRVAFIAVSTPALSSPSAAPTSSNVSAATATELRYYSDANILTNYKVIAHLVLNQNDLQEVFIQRPRPFQILNSPAVTVTLCTQSPDYTNRSATISDANTFTRVQSTLSSRCPTLLTTGPF